MASHRSAAVKLSVVPILAAAFLAGCGEEEEQETAYCVDANETVVDNSNCDDEADRGFGGGGFFWFFAGAGLGRTLGPGSRVTGLPGDRVGASDRAALANRGGFGSRARSTGVGRDTGRTIGGGGGFFGRSGGG